MTFTLTYAGYIYTVTFTRDGELVEVLRQFDVHEIPINIELDEIPDGLRYKLENRLIQ